MRSLQPIRVFGAALLLMLLTQCGGTPPEDPTPPESATSVSDGDWPMYRHDLAATGYSPLAEITTANVANLGEAWTYSLDAEGGGGPGSQATPIVVDGVMYLPTSDSVVALDPDTGNEIWRHQIVYRRQTVDHFKAVGLGTTALSLVLSYGNTFAAL